MILNDLKEESFKTEIIELRHVGTIFHTKEYEVGKFIKKIFPKLQRYMEIIQLISIHMKMGL